MPQTQTPTVKFSYDDAIDYTPNSATYAGDVIVIDGLVFVALHDIDLVTITKGALTARGIFTFPTDGSTFAQGDPVWWNPTGTPTGGTSGAGCATSTSAGASFAGYAAAANGTNQVNCALAAHSAMNVKKANVNTVAAAGSTIADAAALTEGFNLVTGANATKGVILPVGKPGMQVEVKNADAANAVLKVWPQTGAAINAISASTDIAMAANTSAVFRCLSATQWYTIPLVPS